MCDRPQPPRTEHAEHLPQPDSLGEILGQFVHLSHWPTVDRLGEDCHEALDGRGFRGDVGHKVSRAVVGPLGPDKDRRLALVNPTLGGSLPGCVLRREGRQPRRIFNEEFEFLATIQIAELLHKLFESLPDAVHHSVMEGLSGCGAWPCGISPGDSACVTGLA